MKSGLLKVVDFFKQLLFRMFLLLIILTAIAYYFYFYKPSETGLITGKIRTFNLSEISGLVVSDQNSDTLWVHNDSGHSSVIYAISKRGNLRAQFELKDANLRDIEDIALYQNTQGENYLMVADLGSNTKKSGQSVPKLLIFKEPDLLTDLCNLSAGDGGQSYQISDYQTYEIAYPKIPDMGHSDTHGLFNRIINELESSTPNVEALIVDSEQREILLFTKNYTGFMDIFSLPLDTLKLTSLNTAVYEGTLNIKQFTEGYHVDYRHLILSPINFPYAVTGADLSRDQKTLLIRTYGAIWEWKRDSSEKKFSEIIQAVKPQYIISSFEPLGESIGIDLDNKGFYTISEGLFSKIYYNKLP